MVDLIGQLAALNVQYLGISVGVILGTGILVSVAIPVLLYFLNFRPNKIRLSKLEVEIKAEKESNSSKFEELLNKQIKSFQDLEVSINTEKESNEARFERFLQAQEKRFPGLGFNYFYFIILDKNRLIFAYFYVFVFGFLQTFHNFLIRL